MVESDDLIWVPILAGYERWLDVSESMQIIDATLAASIQTAFIGNGTSSSDLLKALTNRLRTNLTQLNVYRIIERGLMLQVQYASDRALIISRKRDMFLLV